MKRSYPRKQKINTPQKIKQQSLQELNKSLQRYKYFYGLSAGSNTGKNMIYCLFQIASYTRLKNAKKAINLLIDAKMIAELFSLTDMIKQILFKLASIRIENMQFQDALQDCQELLAIENKYHSKSQDLCLINYNLGIIHQNQSQFMTAVDYFHKAAKMLQQLKKQKQCQMATVYQNIAQCYLGLKQETRSIKFYQKALALWERLKKPTSIIQGQFNLAKVFYILKTYSSCLKLLYRCLTLGKYQQSFNLSEKKEDVKRWIGNIAKEDGLNLEVYKLALKVLEKNWHDVEIKQEQQGLKVKIEISLSKNDE